MNENELDRLLTDMGQEEPDPATGQPVWTSLELVRGAPANFRMRRHPARTSGADLAGPRRADTFAGRA